MHLKKLLLWQWTGNGRWNPISLWGRWLRHCCPCRPTSARLSRWSWSMGFPTARLPISWKFPSVRLRAAFRGHARRWRLRQEPEMEISKEKLDAYVDGELPPREMERIAAMLATRPD